jgi:hypothetical protein
MLDTTTGEVSTLTLHEGNQVREFYSQPDHDHFIYRYFGVKGTKELHATRIK